MRIYVSIIKKRIILSAHGKRYASIQTRSYVRTVYRLRRRWAVLALHRRWRYDIESMVPFCLRRICTVWSGVWVKCFGSWSLVWFDRRYQALTTIRMGCECCVPRHRLRKSRTREVRVQVQPDE